MRVEDLALPREVVDERRDVRAVGRARGDDRGALRLAVGDVARTGCLVNRSSSSFWDIVRSWGTSYAMAVASSLAGNGDGPSAARRGEDVVGRLLGDHVDRAGAERSPGSAERPRRRPRAGRGCRARGSRWSARRPAPAARSRRCRTRGGPRHGVAHEVPQARRRTARAAPGSSSSAMSPSRRSRRGDAPSELDARDDRVQILARRVVALLEVAEVDVRRVARIGRAQGHLAGAVAGVGLEDRPREVVEALGDGLRVAGKVALELRQQAEAEEIREARAPARSARSPRGSRRWSRTPRVAGSPTRRCCGSPRANRAPSSTFQCSKAIRLHHADLVAVLEVPAHAGQLHADLDAVALAVPRAARCRRASGAAAC